MADGRHFENSFICIDYLSRELSDFDQIWYSDANFHSEGGFLAKKFEILQIKNANGRRIENRFKLYLGAILAD